MVPQKVNEEKEQASLAIKDYEGAGFGGFKAGIKTGYSVDSIDVYTGDTVLFTELGQVVPREGVVIQTLVGDAAICIPENTGTIRVGNPTVKPVNIGKIVLHKVVKHFHMSVN